jgi:malonate-semialdehyde dehydrogenase (acetylating)/methylmalonate-semialdehyde dehydrogenase
MIKNLIGGDWLEASSEESLPVFNPATGKVINVVGLSAKSDLEAAESIAVETFNSWSQVPITERVQLMWKFKDLLERNTRDLAEIITLHHGKTLQEAAAEVRRGIEAVDFACSAPSLLQGYTLREASRRLDQNLYKYPIGVVAGITPFNFPAMIPLWMFPIAVVSGNTFILKPSERTPMGAEFLGRLFLEAGFPPGVLQIINGDQKIVAQMCDSKVISAISFVGSEPAARQVYERACLAHKRVQALGGAKNYCVVMPDADFELACSAILNSAFGNAGERCLAGSMAVVLEPIKAEFTDLLVKNASSLVVGPGTNESTDVGPLIRKEHRDNIVKKLYKYSDCGADIVLDGNNFADKEGYYLGPTIVDNIAETNELLKDEIFGPVLGITKAHSFEEAVKRANSTGFGNMSVIFTSSGLYARRWREEVDAGMIGINVPIAQPLAFYPFSGWKSSFYGDLHVQGRDGFEFYTRKKMVTSRW